MVKTGESGSESLSPEFFPGEIREQGSLRYPRRVDEVTQWVVTHVAGPVVFE